MSDELKLRVFSDLELMYSATERCVCGAGLAYPLDHDEAMRLSAYVCSKVLKGEADPHGIYSFAFYKIREETSINNRAGSTTRPSGTSIKTVGRAICPRCGYTWESQPYVACSLLNHWDSGPCERCNYLVGGNGPIAVKFMEVVTTGSHE